MARFCKAIADPIRLMRVFSILFLYSYSPIRVLPYLKVRTWKFYYLRSRFTRDSQSHQPSATSNIIISTKPNATPTVAMLVCSPCCASGINSSTTT